MQRTRRLVFLVRVGWLGCVLGLMRCGSSDSNKGPDSGANPMAASDPACATFCEAEAATRNDGCAKALPADLCTAMCSNKDPKTYEKKYQASGVSFEELAQFFACATQGATVICNPATQIPEVTGCDDSQTSFNLWILSRGDF